MMYYMDEVCEHCLIHIYLVGLYGRSRTYKCAKGISLGYHGLSNEPCNGQPGCHKYDKKYSHGRGEFLYKLIPRKKMKKSKERLEQEEEDKKEREEKADRLEREGVAKILEAKELREKR